MTRSSLLCAALFLTACPTAPPCGDGKIDAPEVCDGAVLNAETCQSRGFGAGALKCAPTCMKFDMTACGAPVTCGNGVKEGVELCDGADVAGQTCVSQGYGAGALRCSANCGGFDTSGCGATGACGNGRVDPGEVCDGAALNGATCQSLGNDFGTLKCLTNCSGYEPNSCGKRGTRFGSGAKWTIPTTGGDVARGWHNLESSSFDVNDFQWTTLDMDGDGKPDLLSHGRSVQNPAPMTGTTVFPHGHPSDPHWLFFKNTGSGFGTGLKWTIPPAGGDTRQGWYSIAGSSYDVDDFQWVTLDMDGDRLPDLLSYSRAVQNPAPMTGTTAYPHGWPNDPHWLFFKNTGSGFAPGVKWALPTAGGDIRQGWYSIAGASYDVDDFQWVTMDMDGDGKPDLLSYSRAVANPAPMTGTTAYPHGWPSDPHWLIFKNTGTGFGTGLRWTIPPSGGDVKTGWYSIAGGSYDVGDFQWVTMDMDGDRLPDLISYSRAVQNPAPMTGTTAYPHGWPNDAHWLFFKNNGTGFAPGVKWTLPTAGGDVRQGWYSVNGNSGEVGDFQWVTLDLDGDRLPDLVSYSRAYQDPAPSTGTTAYPHGWPADPHWLVFPGSGTGFGTGLKWNLPTSGGDVQQGWYSPLANAYDLGDFQWSFQDMDGDGRGDLISYSRAYQDPAPSTGTTGYPHGWPGDPHWLFFANSP